MNTHKNARLTSLRRLEMVQAITEQGLSASQAGAARRDRPQAAQPLSGRGRCRPQTNGKAERFIQSALREWAYGHAYANSEQRRAALPLWNHFYNWHRPHHGIGCQTPSSRLPRDGNNVLTLHT